MRELGSSGLRASVVGLGTWAIGGGPWWGPTDDGESERAIREAVEAELLPHCLGRGIATLIYSPLQQGLLTGRYGMDWSPGEGEYRNLIPWFRPANRRRVLGMLSGWGDLLGKYGCTTGQLVIAWIVAQPGVSVALCGARHPAQARENAVAGGWELDACDVARMRRDVEALGAPEE